VISCDWVLLVQCSVIALSLSRRRFHGIVSQFRTPEILLGIGEGGGFSPSGYLRTAQARLFGLSAAWTEVSWDIS